MGIQKTVFETRAKALGLVGGRSPRAMAARTKKSLAKIRERIEQLAAPYDEINNTVEVELWSLLGAFDQFEETINDTVKWLEEEADYDQN